MKWILRGAVLLLAAYGLTGRPSAALADGVVRDAIGAIPTGRGGVNTAFADNGVILHDNPAAMVNIASSSLTDLGLDTVICDLHYTDVHNDARGETKPFPSGYYSYIRRSDDGLWAWGIGAFAPAGFAAEYDMFNPVTGTVRYKSLGMLGKILPGVAVRLTDRLSIGGTAGLALTHLELEGPFTIQTGAFAGVPTFLDLQSTGTAFTGSFGLQYELTESTVIGASYLSESRFHTDGTAAVDVYGFGPTAVHSRFDADVNIVWPRSLSVGVRQDFCDCRRFSAELVWFDWSEAFERLDIRLNNPTNPVLGAVLGPTTNDSFPIRWEDSVSLRLGYEWEPSDYDIWRLGYVYHESPVPDETLNPFLDGVLEHAFSVGYGRRYSTAMLNLAYQFSYGDERTVGQSDILGGDFDNSTFTARAHWISVGLLFPY